MTNAVPHWIALEFAWPFSRRVSIEVRSVLSEIDWPSHLTEVGPPSSEARRKQRLALMEHVFQEVAPVVLEEAKAKHRSSAYDLATVLPVIDFFLARLQNAPPSDLFVGRWDSPSLKTVADMALSLHTEMFEVAHVQSVRFLEYMADDGHSCLNSLVLLMQSLEGLSRQKWAIYSDESCVAAQEALMNAFLWSQIDCNAYDQSDVEAANVKYAEHLSNALYAFIASSVDTSEADASTEFGASISM